ncbi:MAG: alpha/beta fold hydrolase [Sphingomonadales bacterium]|nr:alpha/beta fold hydrolase [Sphingomonadales bacterium]MDE2170505.1 alpha/beta fold hydrolase [Sphingomonadales bacterium]
MFKPVYLALLLALGGAPAMARPVAAMPSAVVSDPRVDAAFPARMIAFQLPSDGVLLNAVMYVAAGRGPHPTLLLFHGFPGNEQNLDLAQAARRAGWNVLTLHYRGSWGSPGSFSYAHCIEDARNAARFLHDPAFAAKAQIDTSRLAVAGHSMGGMMAARAMADVPGFLGAFLIDPWDMGTEGRTIRNPAALKAFREQELDGDLPPLAGTSAEALIGELQADPPEFDLHATVTKISAHPLSLNYATRGLGAGYQGMVASARAARPAALTTSLTATDHSFSDKRIWLAARLARWLGSLPVK